MFGDPVFGDPAVLLTAGGRAVMLLGVFFVVGAALCTWLAPARGIARPVRAGALLLLLGCAAQAAGQLLAFEAWAPDAPPLADTLAMIADTTWGRGRIALVVLALIAGLVSWYRGRWLDAAVRSLALLLVVLLPLLGHAAAADDMVLAWVLVAAHAAGASVWLGTFLLLAPTWWLGVQATIGSLARYGRVALWSAPLAVASGIGTAWTRMDTPASLFGTSYGRLLLLKIAVVLVVLGLGARHHLRLARRPATKPLGGSPLEHDGGASVVRDARGTLRLELLLALLVLALTGWLAESEPPGFDQ